MNTFTPTSIQIFPQPARDAEGQALLTALSRPIGAKLHYNVPRTVVLGILTLGFLPVFSWVKKLATFRIAEQTQFFHLARWINFHAPSETAGQLLNQAGALRQNKFHLWLLRAIIIGTCIFAVRQFPAISSSWQSALTLVFRPLDHNPIQSFWPDIDPSRSPQHNADRLYLAWLSILSLTYLYHYALVRTHVRQAAHFIQSLNRIGKPFKIDPIKPRPLGIPIRPLWLLAVIPMAVVSPRFAVVGACMMLAGSAHRIDMLKVSYKNRKALAKWLQSLMKKIPTPAHTFSPVYLRQRCPNPLCQAETHLGARYCSRCGERPSQYRQTA